jgi:hypothetical protein
VELAGMESQRDEAQAELSHTKELLDGAQTTLAAEREERAVEVQAIVEQRDTWMLQAQESAVTLAQAQAELAGVTAERDALKDVETDAGLANETAAKAYLAQKAAQEQTQRAEDAKVAAEQLAAQAEAAKAAAEAAYAERDAQFLERLNIEAQRVSKVITAHRALMVDTMRRVMTKEADRARRHQATPQKLRAWMGTFYPEHVETLAGALEPVIAAQLAWRQTPGDAAALAREIAEAHCEQSQEQLRMVCAVEDFSASFEKLMQRWEANRPEAVADQFMQEGVSHVRNI